MLAWYMLTSCLVVYRSVCHNLEFYKDGKNLCEIQMGSPQQGCQIEVVQVQTSDIPPMSCYISEAVQDVDVVTTKGY